METEEERRTRLENDASILKSWQLYAYHSKLLLIYELLSASLILLYMYLITYTDLIMLMVSF